MKNLLMGLLLGLSIAFGTAAFQGFGPVQTKALIKVLVAEFNRNRDWHGKERITANQVRDELETTITELQNGLADDPDFQWMKDATPR